MEYEIFLCDALTKDTSEKKIFWWFAVNNQIYNVHKAQKHTQSKKGAKYR